MRHILERGVGASLTDASNERKLIPAALQVEYSRLGEELGPETRFAIITDSTTRAAEVLVGAARFWRGGVRQRCIGLEIAKRSFTAPELVGAEMKMVSKTKLAWTLCIVKIFDSCATNLAAYSIAKGSHTVACYLEATRAGIVDDHCAQVRCSPHFTSGTGSYAKFDYVKKLVSCMVSAHASATAMGFFKDVFGVAHKGNSEVRWYCKFEIAEQVKDGFPLLLNWVTRCEEENVAAASIASLRDLLSSHLTTVKLELAAQSDALKPFVQVCYHLEGDQASLVFDVHDDYQRLGRHIHVCRGLGQQLPNEISLPQTYAVARAAVDTLPPASQGAAMLLLVHEQIAKMEPAFTYFELNLEPEEALMIDRRSM